MRDPECCAVAAATGYGLAAGRMAHPVAETSADLYMDTAHYRATGATVTAGGTKSNRFVQTVDRESSTSSNGRWKGFAI